MHGYQVSGCAVSGGRIVQLYAVEAADNWFEDAGSGQLANGGASVTLDPLFAETVNSGLDYHVFFTPNGECKGLYVTQKTAHGFEVSELHGGQSNISFDYRIMVRRKGYENAHMGGVTRQFAQVRQNAELIAGQEAGAAESVRPEPLRPAPPKVPAVVPPLPPHMPPPPKVPTALRPSPLPTPTKRRQSLHQRSPRQHICQRAGELDWDCHRQGCSARRSCRFLLCLARPGRGSA